MEDQPQDPLRRRLVDTILRGGLLALLGSVLYPVLRFVMPPRQAEAQPNAVLAAKVDELTPNSGKVFRFGSKPAILISTPQGELRAFSAVCTHLACTVQYRGDFQHIWCACHNGHYDLHGLNISGPPPRPLPEYRVLVQGDEIYVARPT